MVRIALSAIVLLAVTVSARPGISNVSEWSAPVNIGNVVNSTFAEGGPAISKNGLSLYFHSERPGGYGSTDIWVSATSQPERSPWGPPAHLGPAVNTVGLEAVAALSRNEHLLFFASDRPGSWDPTTSGSRTAGTCTIPFDWEPAVNLGAGVNSIFNDSAPSYVENDGVGLPQLFFHSTRPGGVGGTDIYVSEHLANGTFGPASLVVELSGPGQEQHPSIRFDGLEMFFFSDRPPSQGGVDLWSSTRRSIFDAWSTPTNLGPPVNTASSEVQPYISSDGLTLFFQSPRPDGGFGSQDIWTTTRTRRTP